MRQTVTIFLGGLALIAGILAVPAPVSAQTCGDLNNDGSVTVADLNILSECAGGSCPAGVTVCGTGNLLDCGDIFGDGDVSLGGAITADLGALSAFLGGRDPLYDICTGPGPAIACTDPPSGRVPGATGSVTLAGGGPASINSSQTWPRNCEVIIGGLLTIVTPPGGPTTVIRIEDGSIVQGQTGTTTANPAALIFQPGSRIDAQGGPSGGGLADPIIFTSTGTPGSRSKGEWGGVVFNGRGTVNGPNCQFQSEGLPFSFGGCEADYHAGVATFVRVEFAGLDFSANNELNLWTMNGIGTQTQFNFIQAHAGDDDCHEWFGGTSNHTNLVASACGDDGFDWQLGWTGSLQYGLMLQSGFLTDTGRDSRGIEADNSEFDNLATPVSDPSLCNVTLVGGKNQPGANDGSDAGVLLRRGTRGQLANLIVLGFEDACVELRDVATTQQACANPSTLAGNLVIRNSIMYDCGSTLPPVIGTEMAKTGTIAGGNCSTAEWYALLPNVVNADGVAPTVDPGLSDQYPALDNTDCTGNRVPYNCCTGPGAGTCRRMYNGAPNITGPAPAPFACSQINPLFENPGYIGGINPSAVCTDSECDWMTKPWIEFALD
jgi:hypothetical protein